MYAIFDNGGKQYKASVGDVVKLEKLGVGVGAKVTFPIVLTSDDGKIAAGKDVEGQVVTAEVVGEGKDKKIIVFTYKAKKNVRHKQGHRQPYTTVKITAIGAAEQAPKRKRSTKKTEEAVVESAE